jgi:fatty acid desaturase
MKGINPFYFYLTKGIGIAGLVFLPLYAHIVDFKSAIVVGLLLIIIYTVFITYWWKKISKINKGKIIKSVNGKIRSWHYLLAGLLLMAIGGYLCVAISWTMVFILLLGFIVSNFNQTHYITIYENGAVFDGTAYYDWNEIEETKNGNKTIWKIKNIPKIVINEN